HRFAARTRLTCCRGREGRPQSQHPSVRGSFLQSIPLDPIRKREGEGMTDAGQAKAGTAREGAPSRVIIEDVRPAIDDGQFPIKRTVGEEVVVTADIFAEGHDILTTVIQHRDAGTPQWNEVAMTALVNDAWTGRFLVNTQGWHEYTV